MRKHWLLLTCSCVATAMAPPRLARRRFIGAATAFVPGLAVGANLPSDNGAKGDQRGTVAALVPIVRVASSVLQASRAVQAGKLQDAQKALEAIPAAEKPFKRLFDEYSEPVSYKQNFKDKNAFLVYYTQGFDRRRRPPIYRGTGREGGAANATIWLPQRRVGGRRRRARRSEILHRREGGHGGADHFP